MPLVRIGLQIVQEILHVDVAVRVSALLARREDGVLPLLRPDRTAYVTFADLDKHFLGPVFCGTVNEALQRPSPHVRGRFHAACREDGRR